MSFRMCGILEFPVEREGAAYMSMWQGQLAGARNWQEYRGALHTYREDGPAFARLPDLSEDMAGRGIPGLKAYTGVATYSALVDPHSSKRPKWDQVELLVRICAEHRREPDAEAVVADWAAAYHRCGGDPGPRFPAPDPAPAPTPAPAPAAPGDTPSAASTVWGNRRIRFAAVAVVVLTLAGLGIRGIVGPGGGEGTDTADAKGGTSSPGASPSGTGAAGSADKGPLFLTSSWPTLQDCDGATSVAMPAGGPPLTSFLAQNVDFRKDVTAKGGATWGAGHLYLTLSAEAGKTVVIQGIRPATPRPTPIGPPAWIALTQGGCGDAYNRVFEYDLDQAVLTDKGVDRKPPPGEKPANAKPLGSGFTVSADDPAVIRVDVTACQGNYEWGLFVDYVHAGQSYRRQLGPFRSMGVRGKDTVDYAPDPETRLYGKAGGPPQSAVLCP
ncbi:hypothetical protein [Streptomyces sp. NPDC090445]|uniref:hypothetical protein n=1 Tax=Streptomyces sp. NPDC090445 TaxID=3365963 RepID=UPI0038059E16